MSQYEKIYETKRNQLHQLIDREVEIRCNNLDSEIHIDEINDLVGQAAAAYRQWCLANNNDEYDYGHDVQDAYYVDSAPW